MLLLLLLLQVFVHLLLSVSVSILHLRRRCRRPDRDRNRRRRNRQPNCLTIYYRAATTVAGSGIGIGNQRRVPVRLYGKFFVSPPGLTTVFAGFGFGVGPLVFVLVFGGKEVVVDAYGYDDFSPAA